MFSFELVVRGHTDLSVCPNITILLSPKIKQYVRILIKLVLEIPFSGETANSMGRIYKSVL